MEKIMVFTGMEVHGTVEMTVLKTFANGTKLCWFDHKNDDESESWDELWIAQDTPFNREYGGTKWYGIDSQNVRVDLDGDTYVKEYRAEFKR
jgi:hypothetical protein